jgi:hypothetical protein
MTELNAVVGASLAGILSINKDIEALVQEAKSRRQTAMDPFLDALAASGEVSAIVVRGYTPGFNDGEPCEHSADIWVNLEQMYGDDLLDSSEDYGMGLEDDAASGFQRDSKYDRDLGRYVDLPGAKEANVALAAKLGHVWSPPSEEILAAIRTLIFTTIEEEEDTNYWVSYILTDGKLVRHSGEYDCGY